MRGIYFCVLITALIVCCKSEKNDVKNSKDTDIEMSVFESKLLDLRTLNQQFTPQLKVEKFGIQKVNDSTSNFVFKLNSSAEAAVVNSYSFGIIGYYYEAIKPYRSSYSPKMKIKDGNNYIVLRNKAEDINYFDSLYVYIYERKNWKGSGELGNITVKDILIEEENE